MQHYVDALFDEHYFTLLEKAQHRAALMRMAVFDIVVNDADRKSGHCLVDGRQELGIDNGLCFHAAPKLRTVIWDFVGEEIDPALLADLAPPG